MAFDSDAEVAQISSKENAAANQAGATTDQEIDKTPIIPVSPDAPSPDYKHPKHDAPSEKWEYRDAAPIEAALAYTACGWGVFPVHSLCNGICSCGNPKCGSDGKHPRTKNGHKDATRDEQQIHAWWNQYPDANIGVATGSISGILVLDVDPGHGGDESLVQLTADHGGLPTTIEQKSGGGGWHYFFRHADGVQNSAGVVGAGLDVRGEGGYIIVAPSKTVGEYRWRKGHAPGEIELAEAPSWLIDLARKLKHSDGTAGGPTMAFEDAINRFQTGTPYGEAGLISEAEAVANTPIGSQESTLNAAAFKIGTLVGVEQVDLAWAYQVLIGAGMRMKNDPARGPWTHADVEKKVRRGLVDGIAKPRRSAVEQMATKHSNGDLGYLECSLTGAELAELEIRPPEWLIEGVMERGSITLVQGQYKAFKTFTAYGFAESLCSGIAFVEYPVPEKRRVALFDGEMPIGQAQNRYKKMIGPAGHDKFLIQSNHSRFQAGFAPIDITDERHQQEIEKILTFHKSEVVIFDNYAALRSLVDENDAADPKWHALRRWLIDLRFKGLAVVLIHHTGHGGKHARGTSELPGLVDTIIHQDRINETTYKISFTCRGPQPEPGEKIIYVKDAGDVIVLTGADIKPDDWPAILKVIKASGSMTQEKLGVKLGEALETKPWGQGAVSKKLKDGRAKGYVGKGTKLTEAGMKLMLESEKAGLE